MKAFWQRIHHGHYDQGHSNKSLIILIALTACILFAFFLRWYFHMVIGGQGQYMAWAYQNFFGHLAKQNLLFSDAMLHKGIMPKSLNDPGYVIFISLVRLLGVSTIEHLRLVQAAIDTLIIIPLFVLLLRLNIKANIAIFIVLIYAVFPPFAISSTLIYDAWIAPVLFIMILLCISFVPKNRNLYQMIYPLIGGITIAIGVLFSWYFILFVIPYFLWIIIKGNNWPQKCLAMFFLFFGMIVIFSAWKSYAVELKPAATAQHVVAQKSSGARKITIIKLNKDYAKHYITAWQQYPGQVATMILQRWKRLIFTSARIPGYTTYFPILGYLLRFFGVLALIGAAILYRKQCSKVLLVALPFLYSLLINVYTPSNHLFTTTMVLSYLLACGLLAQWSHRYISDHPTPQNKYFFKIIAYAILAYIFIDLAFMIFDVWRVVF